MPPLSLAKPSGKSDQALSLHCGKSGQALHIPQHHSKWSLYEKVKLLIGQLL